MLQKMGIVVAALLIVGGLLGVVIAVNEYASTRLERSLQRLEQERQLDQQFQRDVTLALEECEADPDCQNVPFGLADEP